MGIIDNLKYLNEVYNQTTISNLTGIPKSTLSYSIRGERNLPLKYYENVYDLTHKVAYSNLFNYGVPTTQAALLSLENVNMVREKESYVQETAHKLTMGYILTLADDENEGIVDQAFIDDYYPKALADIQASLRASTKPIEEWQDYFSPNQSVL